jgi:stage III sporulation protein AD
MEILQIAGLGVAATITILVIKAEKPEVAIQISIVTGIVIIILLISKLSAVLELINSYARKINIDMAYFSTLLKIVGVAYIAEFGAEICRDTGETSIASKIELAGKVIIAVLAVPIITSLLELIINIMP